MADIAGRHMLNSSVSKDKEEGYFGAVQAYKESSHHGWRADSSGKDAGM